MYPLQLSSFDENPRYRILEVLRRAEMRCVSLAEDRLTGRTVVMKTGPARDIHREARVLLEIPPGVGPRLLDIMWGDAPALVLEYLPGRTLLETASTLDPTRVAGIVLGMCEGLIHLHRAGYVHLDLKPGNVLLLDHELKDQVRLLDFGFSFAFDRRSFAGLTRGGAGAAEGIGGTFGYAAPEVVRGWRIDARADQYSLGVTLDDAFPSLRHDERWSDLNDKLREPLPSNRFRDVAEVVAVLQDRFSDVEPTLAGHSRDLGRPRFGGGPLRGRQELLERIRAQAFASDRNIRLHGAPHSGLTRLLHEALLDLVEADPSTSEETDLQREEPRFRALDLDDVLEHRLQPARPDVLGGLSGGPNDVEDRILAFLEACARSHARVLVALSDPALDARSLTSAGFHRLRAVLVEGGSLRFPVSPLTSAEIEDTYFSALGAPAPGISEAARWVHRWSEGDLHEVADAFNRFVGEPVAGGLAWSPLSADLCGFLPGWPQSPRARRLMDSSATEIVALQIAARAGSAPSLDLLDRLMQRFAPTGSLLELIQAGWLTIDDAAEESTTPRARWLSSNLREQALAWPLENGESIDRWLLENWKPAIDDAVAVREAALCARRLGEVATERGIVREALEAAVRQDLRPLVLALLHYPERPSEGLSLDGAKLRAAELSAILGGEWHAERILLTLGLALFNAGESLGLRILQDLAEDPTRPEGVLALFHCTYYFRTINRSIERAETWARLEKLEQEGVGPPPGYMDLERCRWAMERGDMAEARRLAERARTLLRGNVMERDAFYVLSALEMPERPQGALAYMREAIAVSSAPETRASIWLQTSLIHESTGDLQECAAAAERAVGCLQNQGAVRTSVRCGIQRAWSMLHLDRLGEAEVEANKLLQHRVVRQDSQRRSSLLLLLGVTATQRGSSAGVGSIVAAWDTAQGSSLMFQASILNSLVDALLDLGAWDLVRWYGDSIFVEPAIASYSNHAVARWSALQAQAKGDQESALVALTSLIGRDLAVGDVLAIGGSLYHLGTILTGTSHDGTASACELFNRAIEQYSPIGHAYWRARTLLARSGALAESGDAMGAARDLEGGISLARQHGFRRLLAYGLASD